MKAPEKIAVEPGSSHLSADEIAVIKLVKARLLGLGWALVLDRNDEESRIFSRLIPLPRSTFSAINSATGECRAIALHLNGDTDGIRYVGTMQLANGEFAQEHGHLKSGADDATTLMTHNQWHCPVDAHTTELPED